MEKIAIAYVPKQEWKEVYDETKALENGTIFPELDLPFYVTETERSRNKIGEKEEIVSKDGMLLQIQKIGFVLDDLRLYLDTHPSDKMALDMLKTYIKRKKELMKEFALQFYPLTLQCMADIYEKNPESQCYCWGEGPAPWEGVC